MSKKQNKQKAQDKQNEIIDKATDFFWIMRRAVIIDKNMGIIQTLPLIFFAAVIIFLVRMVRYTRPMEQFYWSTGNTQPDFFSYGKMAAILICAAVAIMFLIYRAFTKTLAIKRTILYVPMLVYSAFVILSYAFSEYKDFSLLGFNERFEGTLVLLSYMVMLFYAINTVNSEKNVKYTIYPIAASSFLLSLIGISQAIGHDFFRTRLGGMLILPKTYWDKMDKFVFKFGNNEIYQTVYNINYVSFYLTLLLPVFGLLFLNSIIKGKQEKLSRKIIWGALTALLVFNLIGSSSAGGYLGVGIAVFAAIIVLYKKILSWWKPIAVLAGIILIVGGITFDRWLPKLTRSVKGALLTDSQLTAGTAFEGRRHIDYMEVISKENTIKLGIDGNGLTFIPQIKNGRITGLSVLDARSNLVALKNPNEGQNIHSQNNYYLDDNRFKNCAFRIIQNNNGNDYLVVTTDNQDWIYHVTSDGLYYVNVFGKRTEIKKIDAIGFKNNQRFGSGRGYIWSRTIPMMKDTILMGRGADTFCIYFPQNDYAGKYNAGFNLNSIIDKPHNMYMLMSVGTGGISLAAFLVLLAVYFAQSFNIYRGGKFDSFIESVGLGIFLGILGFAVSGLVNDSTVSVMPLFYAMLGTGIAINIQVKNQNAYLKTSS